jgi:hypothetical protein
MQHTCHAHGCPRAVAPRLFACVEHWRALRKELRDAIWKEYRSGQEVDKNPSLRYLAVQQLAVAELAFRPNDEAAAAAAAPFLLTAVKFAREAVAAGQGNPLSNLISRDLAESTS